MKSIHKSWKRDKRIDPFIMTWPSETIVSDEGTELDGPCTLELPADTSQWDALMLKAIDRTNAYAVLLVEQRESDVRGILETSEGARCWLFPIARSGDAKRLGSPRVSDNKECLGLLWRPAKIEA